MIEDTRPWAVQQTEEGVESAEDTRTCATGPASKFPVSRTPAQLGLGPSLLKNARKVSSAPDPVSSPRSSPTVRAEDPRLIVSDHGQKESEVGWSSAFEPLIKFSNVPMRNFNNTTQYPFRNRSLEPVGLPATEHRATNRRSLVDAFRRLVELRKNVLALRFQYNEARTSLKYQQENLKSRDAELIHKLRAVFLQNDPSGLQGLFGEFESLQEDRNRMQPKEEAFDNLEQQLNRQEWELKEYEAKVYRRDFSAQISLIEGDKFAVLQDMYLPSDSSASTRSDSVQKSPRVRRCLSREGDAQLLRERIVDLRMERAQIVEEEKMRTLVGLDLDDDSRAFLENFDRRHNQLLEELYNVEEDISRLRDAIEEKDDVYFLTDQFNDTGSGQDGSTHDQAEEELSTSILHDPLWLREDEQDSAFSGLQDELIREPIDTAHFINMWLLHLLRRSPLQIRLYKASKELKDTLLTPEEIKDLVLQYWYNDGSVEGFSQAQEKAAQSLGRSVRTTKGLQTSRAPPNDSGWLSKQDFTLPHRTGKFRSHSDPIQLLPF